MAVYLRNFSNNKVDEGGSVQNAADGLAALLPGGEIENSVTKLMVLQMNQASNGHWELYFSGPEISCVKMDLTQNTYRILYGAKLPQFAAGKDPTNREEIDFTSPMTLRDVVNAASKVMAAKGDWTGTHDYNCQDFVAGFLQEVTQKIGEGNVKRSSSPFKYELQRAALKMQHGRN